MAHEIDQEVLHQLPGVMPQLLNVHFQISVPKLQDGLRPHAAQPIRVPRDDDLREEVAQGPEVATDRPRPTVPKCALIAFLVYERSALVGSLT